jgi:hypothetical protein
MMQPLPSDFLIYEENFVFFFISVYSCSWSSTEKKRNRRRREIRKGREKRGEKSSTKGRQMRASTEGPAGDISIKDDKTYND